MRLTNHIRSVFVKAVMQDIPKPDYQKIGDDLQEALYAAMSADVRRVYRKVPKALRTGYEYNFDERGGGRTFIVGDADFEKVKEPFVQQSAAWSSFRKKLTSAIEVFTTVKQVRDAFPELAHHLPSESKPTAQLPATSNLVEEMVKLGWKPKDEPQQ